MQRSSRFLRAVFAAGFAAAVAVLLAACGGSDREEYVVYSGGEAGVYYPTASMIAGLVNASNDGFELTVRTSGGSAENARALGSGDADFALIQNDIAAYARSGELDFEQPITNFLGVAALYPEYIQVVTLADSGIETLADLADRRVAIGAVGSGTEQDALKILEAAGLDVDDLASREHLSAADSVSHLRDGRVDAAFFTFGLGTPAIAELADSHTIRLLAVDGAVRDQLLAQHEFYRAGVVPAGSYGGVDSDVETVVVTATLVARESVPAEVVERTLAAIFEDLQAFDGGRLDGLTPAIAREHLSLPLHPGAEAFYSR